MSFAWPQVIWLLLAVPALIGIYIYSLRRRHKLALRYPSLALLRAAAGPGYRWRRHLPPLLILLCLVTLIVGIARPRAAITLPSEERTIVLAMDVSLSMRATDVEPSRIGAAREAAKAFVMEQPSDVRIGIVAFAMQAALVQKPTRDRDALITAIDQLHLQIHTAIGSAIIMSLATLFPNDGLELEAETYTSGAARDKPRAAAIDAPRASEKKELTPVPPGSYRNGAIILLTDGRRTIGPDPLEAARLAADRGVKVYTVGFGKSEGGATNVDGYSIYMRFDEETLKSIAQITGADYFRAGNATDLKKVYETLNARYMLKKEDTEVTALFCAVAAALALAAAVLSLSWYGRIA
jgi:Ca-activated chloride channel family protein